MTERLSDYDFILPEDRIAQHPVSPRDTAKLLDATTHGLQDRIIADLPDLLSENDILVVNNTQVIPAQIYGRKGEGSVGFTLHQRISENCWRAFAKPARKCTPGTVISFSDELTGEISEKYATGEVEICFSLSGDALDTWLEQSGQMPLPPYIKRPKHGDSSDHGHYQTMFAAHKGAVAAPTAGLHFTPELKTRLDEKSVQIAQLTLHVGAGTFLPVKNEEIAAHKMHSEWGQIDAQTVQAIENAKSRGGRVIAVGTTSLRLLESAYHFHGKLAPFAGETDIFIRPGFKFGVCDMLLTNFHLPKSTLLMLVSAFSGYEFIKELYHHAIAEQYRFFSYGDACLLRCTAKDLK